MITREAPQIISFKILGSQIIGVTEEHEPILIAQIVSSVAVPSPIKVRKKRGPNKQKQGAVAVPPPPGLNGGKESLVAGS